MHGAVELPRGQRVHRVHAGEQPAAGQHAALGVADAPPGAQALQYGSGQGDPQLRELICEVMSLEGVVASPDDVVVTVGSQQALDLIAHAILDPGDVVLVKASRAVGLEAVAEGLLS